MDYTPFVDFALELISSFGYSWTVSRSAVTYSPDTADTTASPASTQVLRGVSQPLTTGDAEWLSTEAQPQGRFQHLSDVLGSTRKVILAAGGYTFIPKPGDSITDGTFTGKVLLTQSVSPGGTPIVFQVYAMGV